MTLQAYLDQHYSPKTAKAYGREIDGYLGNNPEAESYRYAAITAYLGILRKRYSNPATLNRVLAGIKAYYSFLAHCGTRNDNPAKAVQLKDKRSRDIQLQDLFTGEELENLLTRKTERYRHLTSRNQVLISLLIYQALKPAEIAELECQEINLEAAAIYIKSSPKNNSRTLPLKAGQILLFKRYLEETRPKLLQQNQSLAFMIGHRGERMLAEDISKHIKRSYGNSYPPRNVTAQNIRQSVIANLLKQHHDLGSCRLSPGINILRPPSGTNRRMWRRCKRRHPVR